MASKKLKSFRVGGLVRAWIEVEVKADSFEHAIEQARTLTASDFYETGGEVIDDNLTLTGVSDSAAIDL